jgi:peptidoglycan/LPS O-acetylase OafA/YrhL
MDQSMVCAVFWLSASWFITVWQRTFTSRPVNGSGGQSPILNQLGQTTVALFFMITGFLFTLKAASPKINWKALYLSRLARLGPLYVIIVIIVFTVVLTLSDGVIKESFAALTCEFIMWLLFVVFGRPDINGLPMSWTLIAGVNWSLKYEALFYLLAVPVLHVAARLFKTCVLSGLALCLLVALLLFRSHYGLMGGNSLYVVQFLGGITTAYAFQVPVLRRLIGCLPFKLLAVVCAAILLSMTYSYSNVSVIATTVVFASVVGGASIFGLLNTRAAIWLGDVSFGIYLIHGLTLWMTFTGLAQLTPLADLKLPIFSMIVLSVASLVTLLASFSYIHVERPIMQRLAKH